MSLHIKHLTGITLQFEASTVLLVFFLSAAAKAVRTLDLLTTKGLATMPRREPLIFQCNESLKYEEDGLNASPEN